MTTYGFHASHEQIAPSRLLRDVQAAEQAGFQMAMCSDHITPWSNRQGHSGFAWSWLGAALATTGLRMGCVNAPGQRYHPAIIAQSSATLAEMFPDRFWVALGSGQAMNEHITGPWPRKEVRVQRLEESVDIIRRLHAGEEVSHDGLVTVDRARVYDRPDNPVPLIAAAISADTAARAARWADGLVTINQTPEK
ncbi:LLM class flavin-dependent oxidoreductase, partial [Georgenia sp. 10Sc9-8]|nr:LLM class flavin-dependent oxidoreductase [Georgenia halotolerans]